MKNKGFTLVEVLISMTLLIVSFIVLLTMTTNAMKANKLNQIRNNAFLVASNVSENFRIKKFDSLSTGNFYLSMDNLSYKLNQNVTLSGKTIEYQEIPVDNQTGEVLYKNSVNRSLNISTPVKSIEITISLNEKITPYKFSQTIYSED
ncbi:MAG: prepilin-type N-terminal cleavage/methylation domain-containing protein [Acidobacteriota bacterium]